jgi:hypothetical protein
VNFAATTMGEPSNWMCIPRLLRQAIASAPPKRPKKPFVDAILEGVHKPPRKRRHTWVRIWQPILQELRAECTVRQRAQQRRIELGLTVRETFVPQSYA